jgi:Transglutaminase-like enzymes, putative cysteine proteases
MKIGIRYHAEYTYEKPAGFSPHLVRLFPRADRHVCVERFDFSTGGTAEVQYRRDLFDNEIASCFFPDERDRLEFRLELDLTLSERNPFAFLLDSRAISIPFDYSDRELAVLAPFMEQADSDPLPAELSPVSTPRDTVETLVRMNTWIFENLGYERREEGDPMSPGETLARGAGACRDFARLFAAAARGLGLACRLASGYLWEPEDAAEGDLRAQSALHAWVEIFLPGAGWLGFDPTNGVLCDHHRITAAVGLRSEDISPIRGWYFGKERIASRMDAGLEIVSR